MHEKTDLESKYFNYAPMFKMFILFSVLGLASSVIVAVVDYFKGEKVLWDENKNILKVPRYSFALVDMRDREQFILGSKSKRNIRIPN